MQVLKRLMQRLRSPAGPAGDSEQVAIYVSNGAVATVSSRRGGGWRLRMRADPIAQLADVRDKLGVQVPQLGIGRAACNLVLAPEMYHVNMLERPDVADDEVDEAARWKLQDQVDFPVETVTVGTFELPRSAARDRRMIFVVSVQTEFLKGLVGEIFASGLRVSSIDVSELALRNLAWQCFPQPDQSVALLRITRNSGVINISRGDELYLSRRISGMPPTFSEDSWNDFRERMLLQVQRSIDYYESAMGQPHCNMLMVACTEGWTDRVCEFMTEMMPIPIRTVGETVSADLTLELFNPEPSTVDWNALQDDQVNAFAAALPAIGGALRRVIDISADAA